MKLINYLKESPQYGDLVVYCGEWYYLRNYKYENKYAIVRARCVNKEHGSLYIAGIALKQGFRDISYENLKEHHPELLL